MQATDRRPHTSHTEPTWQIVFLRWLPAIEKQLSFAFRHLDPEAREECVQEAIANCCVRYERLFQQGRDSVASPTSLARFAIRQVRAGRTVGTSVNVHDPLSTYAQRAKAITVERLDYRDTETDEWLPVFVDDHRVSVADQAALRIDVPEWLKGFARRLQEIACDLARGFSTSEVAARYGVSAGRVSQLRKEFYLSWLAFQGQMPDLQPV